MKNENRLSNREEQVLNFIIKSQKINGYPPSIREIAKAIGFKSTSTVQHYINSLKRKGYIRNDISKPRTIEIVKQNNQTQSSYKKSTMNDLIQIPIVGTVAAGNPILAEENIEDYLPLPKLNDHMNEVIFGLRVKGESMINAGILSGDILIVKQCEEAENGEIVIAMTYENEATVKRFFAENGHYRLQPENDNMEPIIIDYVKILGKVLGVMRIME